MSSMLVAANVVTLAITTAAMALILSEASTWPCTF
jgi:hypothetical protein